MSQGLRSKAIRLLARRERSRAELRRLLDPDGDEVALVDQLLDDLQTQGWLSEARLAEQVVNTRRSRGSAGRIRLELRRRGLPQDAIDGATEGLEAGDFAVALDLWRRRFGKIADDRAERERQLRFLLARGFGQGMALKVLRHAGDQDSNDTQEWNDDS
jgi:regulatory protein